MAALKTVFLCLSKLVEVYQHGDGNKVVTVALSPAARSGDPVAAGKIQLIGDADSMSLFKPGSTYTLTITAGD
jgi:hypothetical protein